MSKKHLYIGQPGAASAAVYTSTNQTTSIFSATVCNPTAGAITLEVWHVPSGDTAADDTKIYDALSVPANDEVGLDLLINVTLDNGDAIHMAASSATSLTVSMSGDVE